MRSLNVLCLLLSVFSCKSEQRVKSESTEDGGRIVSQINQNGEIEGAVKHYYPNGNIKSELTIVDHKKEGVEKNFNEQGGVVQEKSWLNGHLMGDAYEFYNNGKISAHRFYTLQSINGFMFLRKYDLSGSVTDSFGDAPYWITFNKSSLIPGDTIELLMFASTSKEFTFKYSIKECVGGDCKNLLTDRKVTDTADQLLARSDNFKSAAETSRPFFWVLKMEIGDVKKNEVFTKNDTIFFNRLDVIR